MATGIAPNDLLECDHHMLSALVWVLQDQNRRNQKGKAGG